MHQGKQSTSGCIAEQALALEAQAHNSVALAALIVRYQSLAFALAKGYTVAGLETEDLAQEALIGFLKAVRSFRPILGVPFHAYASLCMRRQVRSAIRSGLAGKQRPLYNYLPLEEPLVGFVYAPNDFRTASPESLLIQDEEAVLRTQYIRSLLSAFEQDALNLYLGGRSYEEIARKMNSSTKSVDNALQRVRRKLRSMKR